MFDLQIFKKKNSKSHFFFSNQSPTNLLHLDFLMDYINWKQQKAIKNNGSLLLSSIFHGIVNGHMSMRFASVGVSINRLVFKSLSLRKIVTETHQKKFLFTVLKYPVNDEEKSRVATIQSSLKSLIENEDLPISFLDLLLLKVILENFSKKI